MNSPRTDLFPTALSEELRKESKDSEVGEELNFALVLDLFRVRLPSRAQPSPGTFITQLAVKMVYLMGSGSHEIYGVATGLLRRPGST